MQSALSNEAWDTTQTCNVGMKPNSFTLQKHLLKFNENDTKHDNITLSNGDF